MENKVIVQKILRSLPMRFDAKIFVLEERLDLENINMDELHEILIAHEMRTNQDNSTKRGDDFMAYKKAGKIKQ